MNGPSEKYVDEPIRSLAGPQNAKNSAAAAKKRTEETTVKEEIARQICGRSKRYTAILLERVNSKLKQEGLGSYKESTLKRRFRKFSRESQSETRSPSK